MRFFTYVLSDSTALKIGNTRGNVKDRIKKLQVGNPRNIRLIGGFHGNFETELHHKFSGFRLRGEWYENIILTDLMLEYTFLYKEDFLELLRAKT